MIIDAHVHLWDVQKGCVHGKAVYPVGGGRSNVAGAIRQMVPPYMADGRNPVELLLSNMDFAQVNAAVVTQEYLDGNQDAYLKRIRREYPDRIRVCSLYEESDAVNYEGFDGVKICGEKLDSPLIKALPVCKEAERRGMFVAIDLAEGTSQIPDLTEIIAACPSLRITLGHFGMAGRKDWEKQIALAQNPHVYIESGGITWLYNSEFHPYPSAVEAVLRAKEICGIEKLMWGSDYPRTMTAITYRMSLDFI